MNPEQLKAFNDGVDQMKAAAASLVTATSTLTAATEKIAGIEATVSKTAADITEQGERLKRLEDESAEFAEAMKAFGEEPVQAKTGHPAVAIPRAEATGSQIKALPADGADLTHDKNGRMDAFKSIHALA